MSMRLAWCSLVAVSAILTAGCSGGGGNKNAAPQPLIVTPHETSSHFPGNVDFDGRATDPEDGVLAAASMRWEIRDTAGNVVGAFSGAQQTLAFAAAGTYTVVLFATDSRGKVGVAEQTFLIGNTVGELSNPDNQSLVGIAVPFNLDGDAETRAVGVFLSTLTFIGTNIDTNAEVFRLPVAVPANTTIFSTRVTPSVPAGRYKLKLEVATTNVAEKAEDNLYVLADAAPVVNITSPASGSRVVPGTSIAFAGTATDAGGDPLTYSWTSSISGPLSTDLTFNNGALGAAKHEITLTATDPNGLTGSATIDLYIEDPSNPLFVNAASLPNPDVLSLALDGGLIWAGTAAGIASYDVATVVQDGLHDSGYNTNGNAPTLSAAKIASGERLFGGDGIGVSIRNALDTGWSTFDAGLTDPTVYGIAQSPVTSELWFATDAGLTQTAANRAGPVAFDQQPILNRPIFAVAVDAAGVIWAGTDGEGLARIALPATLSNFKTNVGLADDVVNAVFIAGTDVWVGTDDGISRLNTTTSVITTWNDGLPSNTVRSIAVDAEGIVWAGTDNGAARFDVANERWTSFSGTDLAGRVVNAVVVDAQGAVWFGAGPGGATTGGLTRYTGL